MGTNDFIAPLNNKKDTYTNVTGVKPATVSVKANLVKISSEEIKARRISAYRYLLP